MSDNGWQWWSGTNAEWYTDWHDTRDEAIESLNGEGGYIIEGRRDPVSLSAYFDADDFLTRADEDLSDSDIGHPDGDVLFECTPEQERDLEGRVRAAIDAWQEANDLKFVPAMFTVSRNAQYIPKDDDPEEVEREARG